MIGPDAEGSVATVADTDVFSVLEKRRQRTVLEEPGKSVRVGHLAFITEASILTASGRLGFRPRPKPASIALFDFGPEAITRSLVENGHTESL